jgi:tetratricopeptide (TPR) repeat protein
MRLCGIGIMIGFLVAGSPARAGLYNTAEPDEGPLDPNFLGKFHGTLKILQTIGAPKVEVERPLRKRYILQADLFNKLRDPSTLTPEETLNISAVLIRRQRATDAIQLLLPATRRYRDVFLLSSNLATALQLIGEKSKARDTMQDCLDSWPKDWNALTEEQRAFLLGIGWNEGPYAFHREVETYYLKLLRLRSREPKSADSSFDTVDAIFDVKFVGDSGQFEPGKISKAEKAKLPRNTVEIVEQLLVWLPNDARLYWLLGEVLNAEGDVKGAAKIFDELVSQQNIRAAAVMERRQALNSIPDTPTASPGGFEPDNSTPPATGPAPAPFDWRGLATAFAAGIVVAFFAQWQIREIRRRRQSRGRSSGMQEPLTTEARSTQRKPM